MIYCEDYYKELTSVTWTEDNGYMRKFSDDKRLNEDVIFSIMSEEKGKEAEKDRNSPSGGKWLFRVIRQQMKTNEAHKDF